MAHPIRKTHFTWDPDRESRGEVWARIKAHVQQELDRVHAEHIKAGRHARRKAQPHYARNQQLIQAARQGVPVGDLARRYGLSQQRIRELIRMGHDWITRTGPNLPGGDRHPAQHGTPRELDVFPGMIPRTSKMMVGL